MTGSVRLPESPDLDLGDGWEFVRRKVDRQWLGGAGAAAERVRLPHSWNADDTFRPGVAPYMGPGGYRRRFRVPEAAGRGADGAWFLRSGGFYGTGELWLDGERVALLDGQFLGFDLDIGARIRPGAEHLLALRLSNRCRRYVLPGHRSPDFILHGGLAGGVSLRWRPRLRIDDGGVAVRCRFGPRGAVTAVLGCELVNDGAATPPSELVWRILDGDGRVVAEAAAPVVEPARGRRLPLEVEVAMDGCGRWSPEHPRLYRAVAELRAGTQLVDQLELRFGVRELEFRAGDGLFVNGQRLRLEGVNRHEAVPGFGQALPDSLQRRDAELIKATGFNFVRLAHCPQQPAFLDACDELGLTVYAEIATWKSVRSGRWLLRALAQMEGMVRRDRNHPSVLFWGMGNESRSRRAYQLLGQLARRLDPTRPVTYAENHLHRARLNRTTGLADVWAVNYELERAAEACRASRWQSVVVSECLDFPSYGGAPRGDRERERRHLEALVATLERIDRIPFLCGYALWSFSDYATMRLRQYRRHSGLFDAWRVAKPAALLMRARLARSPFVAMWGPWGEMSGGEDDPGWREIDLFSNCDRVRMLSAGGELEVVGCGLHHAVRLPFTGAELVARGERADGEAQARLAAYGAPSRLLIEVVDAWAPREQGSPVELALRVVDDNGVQVLGFAGEAALGIEGPARLHGFAPGGLVLLAAGEGRSYLSFEAPEAVTVRASCAGLEGASTVVGADRGGAR